MAQGCDRVVQVTLRAQGHDLQGERHFLHRYDAVYRPINDAVDMNNNDLVIMARSIVQTGSLSASRQKQLIAKGYRPELIQAASGAATRVLDDLDGQAEIEDSTTSRPAG